jgi:hypothetical protein
LPGELTVGRELLAALVLVVELGCAGFAATVAAKRLVPLDRLLQALTWVLLVLAQATGVSLVLAMVGLFRSPAVLVAHVALAAAAQRWRQQVPAPPTPPRDRSAPAPLDALAAVATGAYVVLSGRLSLQPQRSLDFDTKEYHLANLASWVQNGHLWRLPYAQPGSMTSTHPSSGDLFGAWLSLPSHGDELVYLAPVAFALLAVFAGAVLGRAVAPDRNGAALGALGAVAVLSAPIYVGQVDSMLTDLISAASVVAGVAFLVVARRAERPAALAALAGVALGLGIGSKYTALLPGLVVGAGALVLLRKNGAWRWLLPGPVLFAGPWFIRNLVTTGNPIFPQPAGPFDGAASPYDVLDASMLHHLLHTDGAILRTTATLARIHVGPVLLLIAAGLVLPVLLARRARDPRLLIGVAALTGIGLALYLATPYTGGGPTGLAFIIVSCFRYAMIPAFLGAAVGVALAGRWVGAAAVTAVVGWNLWHIVDQAASDRPELRLTGRDIGIALAITVIVAAIVLLAHHERDRIEAMRTPIAALGTAALVATAGVAVTAVGFHYTDRGRTPTVLERTLLAFGPDEPAVVMGTNDLRAVLGPRFDRPLVKVSRGGAAKEIPFADEAQLRRRVLGEDTAPPPAELGPALDRAIEETGARILVVGPSPLGFPDGWAPLDDWCLAGGDNEGVVFVRAELLPGGVPCVAAPEP